MTMTYQDCMKAILANPEDDAPRSELARVVRDSDPDWARFIELELDRSKGQRETRYQLGGNDPDHLLSKNGNRRRWSRDLDFYMGELGVHRVVKFHRGLPWLCSMNPYVFLEQGEYILNRIAPLRGIEFFRTRDESFPAKELTECPLLARLDFVGFAPASSGSPTTLMPGDMEILASSENFSRLLGMDVRSNNMTLAAYEALATNPETRKCLSIDSSFRVASDGGPIGECSARFDIYPDRHFEMSKEGRDLERKHGYLPWLHNENVCDPADAKYWVDHKVLPAFVPGSAADALVSYGSGLEQREPREARERFDKNSFNAVW